jgi:hypothetical protein
MTKAKAKIAPKAPKARPTAAEIMAQDDRPTFPVDVPEWGLVGETAAIVRQLDTLTVAKIQESCEDNAMGRCMRAARVIVEGCVDPKFGPEHLEALATSKSSTAISRLNIAILGGLKKNIGSMT